MFNDSVKFIQKKIDFVPEIAIILGSGLSDVANNILDPIYVEYKDIPNFPISTVEGHLGRLVFGTLGGKKVVAMQGRFHYYEGYAMQQVTYPIRVFKLLGIKYLFVSNAAGGMNPTFERGDIMIIKDHINFFPENPLRGKNFDEFGERFPEMRETYSKKLIELAHKIAYENKMTLKEGVYIGSSGPTLETPAEYKMFQMLGADATGMSTVPEVIVARHCGIECFGVSVITNIGTNVNPNEKTSHKDVQNEANKINKKLSLLIEKIVENI